MADKILTIKNLTVQIKKNKKTVLNNINLELYSGDVLAIDGFNACGKSTLLKIIAYQIREYSIISGTIIYYPYKDKNIFDFTEKEINEYKQLFCFVSQYDDYDGLNHITVEDLIDDVVSLRNLSKNNAISKFKKFFNNDKTLLLNSKPNKLSGGQKRLLSLFLSIVLNNSQKLIIIDEPLNNLDFKNAMMISDIINYTYRTNDNCSIILVTHCKIITCVNRQLRMCDGVLDNKESIYICHHCMGEPDSNNYYLLNEEEVF